MKPISFKHSNRTLQPPVGKEYSKNIASIESLSVWTDSEQCISCWKMSLKERLAALFFGRAWIAILSGETQPPIYAMVSKEYLQDA